MNQYEVMQLVMNTFIKGAATTIVQRKVLSEKEMNKGRGENRNPFFGRVVMTKTIKGVVMGTDYSRSVAAAATRNGNETSAEDVSLKKVWHKPLDGVEGEWFSTDKATESKIYLKLQRNNKQVAFSSESTYELDGHVANAEETAAIESWMKKKSHKQSSTQVELGLGEDEEQFFTAMQLDTIALIKQREKEVSPYNLLHEVYSMAVASV